MGLNVAIANLGIPTSTGNQAVTGLGFQPTLLIIYATTTTDLSAYQQSIGMGTSSSARWSQCTTAGPGLDPARRISNDKIFDSIYSLVGSGVVSVSFVADLVSLDADGFTLNWTTAGPSGYNVNYCAIGGTDFSAAVGIKTTGTGTGNESITGLPFTPKAVMMYGFEGGGGTNTGTTQSLASGIGAATSSAARWAWTGNTDSVGVAAASACVTDAIWELITSTPSVFMKADFVSLDAAGFTYNITTGAASLDIPWVAFGGTAQYAVGNFGSPTSTGNQSITGVGFLPTMELFASAGQAVSNTAAATVYYSFSATTDVTHNLSSDAVVTNGTGTAARFQQVNSVKIHEATSAVDIAAKNNSQDADGFTNNWLNVLASARTVGYLAIGAAPPPSRFLLVRN